MTIPHTLIPHTLIPEPEITIFCICPEAEIVDLTYTGTTPDGDLRYNGKCQTCHLAITATFTTNDPRPPKDQF